MKFKASPATLKQLTAKRWTKYGDVTWSQKERAEFRSEAMPDWWKPEAADVIQSFSEKKPRGDFATEYENLYYNSSAGEVFYSYDGID